MSKYAHQSLIKRGQRGVTLLEMLVVLLITGLVAALLMQALVQVLDVRGRLLAHIEYQDRSVLRTHWFRASTRGLVGELDDHQDRIFQGDSSGFSGTSVGGLDVAEGIAHRIEWRLQASQGREELLFVSEFGEPFAVIDIVPGSGQFYYLDRAGEWHQQWPPRLFRETPPQLPRAVRFQARHRGEPLLWLAAIPAQPEMRRALLPVEALGF